MNKYEVSLIYGRDVIVQATSVNSTDGQYIFINEEQHGIVVNTFRVDIVDQITCEGEPVKMCGGKAAHMPASPQRRCPAVRKGLKGILRGVFGGPKLIAAIKLGDAKAVESLLQEGFNPNARIRDGSALSVACDLSSGKHDADNRAAIQIVSQLLQHGAKANIDAGIAACRCAPILRLLLQHGADPKKATSTGLTLLHDAALSGNVEAAGILITYGVPVNAMDRDGETPLYVAVRNCPSTGESFGKVIVSKEEAGWRKNPADYITEEKRQHMQAAEERRYLAVMKLLLESGADVNGASARPSIVTRAHSRTVKDFLISCGAEGS